MQQPVSVRAASCPREVDEVSQRIDWNLASMNDNAASEILGSFHRACVLVLGDVMLGYVVFYISARSEGGLKTFGRYLGFWAFTLAGLVILGALFAAAHHRLRPMCPPGEMGRYGYAPHAPPGLQAPPAPPPSQDSATPASPSQSQH
jgi:hypothetical protein